MTIEFVPFTEGKNTNVIVTVIAAFVTTAITTKATMSVATDIHILIDMYTLVNTTAMPIITSIVAGDILPEAGHLTDQCFLILAGDLLPLSWK